MHSPAAKWLRSLNFADFVSYAHGDLAFEWLDGAGGEGCSVCVYLCCVCPCAPPDVVSFLVVAGGAEEKGDGDGEWEDVDDDDGGAETAENAGGADFDIANTLVRLRGDGLMVVGGGPRAAAAARALGFHGPAMPLPTAGDGAGADPQLQQAINNLQSFTFAVGAGTGLRGAGAEGSDDRSSASLGDLDFTYNLADFNTGSAAPAAGASATRNRTRQARRGAGAAAAAAGAEAGTAGVAGAETIENTD